MENDRKRGGKKVGKYLHRVGILFRRKEGKDSRTGLSLAGRGGADESGGTVEHSSCFHSFYTNLSEPLLTYNPPSKLHVHEHT